MLKQFEGSHVNLSLSLSVMDSLPFESACCKHIRGVSIHCMCARIFIDFHEKLL